MATVTAIELGADICALARTSARHDQIRLMAADTLDPASFPGVDGFVAALRQTRRQRHFPKRCRAVVWGLPEGASRKDPAVTPSIAPLVEAGFKVERVVSPCNALAALGRLRTARGPAATCWLAVNRGGVAIVVVRPGEQLYAHSFVWDSTVGATGSQARLLQRYSLVSFLAPEVRRGLAAAREKGTSVDAIVTCGNLPDLRSLTMPLIEELDIEVETLDSLEGLVVRPDATDRLSEIAPAIRIACAGTIARGARPFDPSKQRSNARRRVLIPVAAVVGGACIVGYAWYVKMNPAPHPPVRQATHPPATVPPNPIPPRATPGQARSSPRVEAGRREPATRASAGPPRPSEPPPSVDPRKTNPPVPTAPVAKPESKPVVAAGSAPKPGPPKPEPKPTVVNPPVKEPEPPKPEPTPALVNPPAKKPEPQTPAVAAKKPEPQPEPSKVPGRASTPAKPPDAPHVFGRPSATPPVAALHPPPVRADKVDAAKAVRVTAAPLTDPIPRVTAILVSSDRKLATIDEGHIISIGDVLGRRVVTGIDEHAVVLREPSGVQIRVGLGGRLLGIVR
jgi:hypothetical protein